MKPTGTYRDRMTVCQGFVVDGPGQLSSKMYDSGNKADSIASHKQSARDDNWQQLYFIFYMRKSCRSVQFFIILPNLPRNSHPPQKWAENVRYLLKQFYNFSLRIWVRDLWFRRPLSGTLFAKIMQIRHGTTYCLLKFFTDLFLLPWVQIFFISLPICQAFWVSKFWGEKLLLKVQRCKYF